MSSENPSFSFSTPTGDSDSSSKKLKTSSSLQNLRDRSLQRKKLLAQTLGVASPDELSAKLGRSIAHESPQLTKTPKQLLPPISTSNIDPTGISPQPSPAAKSTVSGRDDEISVTSPGIGESPTSVSPTKKIVGSNIAATPFVIAAATQQNSSGTSDCGSMKGEKTKRTADDYEEGMIDDYFKVLQEEEQVYKSSKTFLKGTQSANPHNDYSQHFVDTGQRPQNFIRDPGLNERFEEYPKLKELIKLKDEQVAKTATPPMYVQADLTSYDLKNLGSRFDVILIEPPLEEDQRKSGLMAGKETWTWDMIEQLDIPSVADTRCFIWIWCGSSPEGTLRGRQCLRQWGFRRCEDICWIKRNTKNPGKRQQIEPGALFHRSKEHCLMGIKGTVRRSVDGDFIHANVDIDLIIDEEPDPDIGEDPRQKPQEIFLVAEHFCLGRRRLHLFGRDDTLRPGWVTVGPEVTSTTYDTRKYRSFFEKEPYTTTGWTDRIETLRPKSPERGGGGGGPGGGRGRGNQGRGGAQRGRGGGPKGLQGGRGQGMQRPMNNSGGRNPPGQSGPDRKPGGPMPLMRRLSGPGGGDRGARNSPSGGPPMRSRGCDRSRPRMPVKRPANPKLAASSRVRNHYQHVSAAGGQRLAVGGRRLSGPSTSGQRPHPQQNRAMKRPPQQNLRPPPSKRRRGSDSYGGPRRP